MELFGVAKLALLVDSDVVFNESRDSEIGDQNIEIQFVLTRKL